MQWTGKLLGGFFGFWLGGLLGAMLGIFIGHQFDKGMMNLPRNGFNFLNSINRERIQSAFFNATFSVMGRLAKADGHVTQAEIRIAEHVMAQMDLSPDMRQAAIDLFNEGKSETFPLEDIIQEFKTACHGQANLIRMFLEIQIQAAYADGELHAAEDRLLLQICAWLEVSEFEYRRLERMIRAEYASASQRQQASSTPSMTPEDAYAILGVSSESTDADIKKAYRRLLSQHHPDKLVSKGLPEEMMKIAAQKTHEIKQAYELIKHR